MTGARSTSTLLARLESVCRRESDERTMRAAILAEIRRVVKFDFYAFVLTDPVTQVGTSPLAEIPDLADLPRVIRAKYLTEANRWTGSAAGFVSLVDATAGRPARAGAWGALLSGYGVRDVASGVLRDRHGTWAFLDLWRTEASGGFTTEELQCLSATLEGITQAVRRTQARAFGAGESTEANQSDPSEPVGPVVMLLSPGLEVLAETEAAAGHLRTLLPTPEDQAPVPACAFNVAAQLLAREAAVDDHPASARLSAGHGRLLTLRAARLAGPGAAAERDIAVTIEPASSAERADLFARAHGLSAREADLLGHLIAGRDTREVSAAMHLSAHTVQDHLKSVFVKTDVRSRRSLVARVLGG